MVRLGSYFEAGEGAGNGGETGPILAGFALRGEETMEANKHTYLTIYVNLWKKLIWSVKKDQRVPHKNLAAARQYAKDRGYQGIRVKFRS